VRDKNLSHVYYHEHNLKNHGIVSDSWACSGAKRAEPCASGHKLVEKK